MVLRAATRGSPLARLQTELVAALLPPSIEVEPVVVVTTGDRMRGVPIHKIGGRGVFVAEVRQAVLAGEADFAVHSAKDLPSKPAEGLVIAAVPQRDDPRDALVGSTLLGLSEGAKVGTGSVRRRAQLAALRPDLAFGELRGNIDTRLAKAADYDAVVMAMAALRRLGKTHVVTEALDPHVMVPQVGQGALAVECRADDDATLEVLAAIEHGPSRRAVDAERAFLATVGGACDLPIGAYAQVDDDGTIHLSSMVATLDGSTLLRCSGSGPGPAGLGSAGSAGSADDPAAVGRAVAHELFVTQGGARLMERPGDP